MDEAIKIYTERVIKECRSEVVRAHERYLDERLRFDLQEDYKNIALGKILCLLDLNHITQAEVVTLRTEIRGVKFDASKSS
jgi:hypothetical protein